MQPNIPLGARHHHTALKIENNQSRRRPTSRSLLKLPVFGLYLQLLSRGKTFLLSSPETDGLIVRKSRENIEPLSLLSSSLLFSLSFIFPFFSSYLIVWSKVKWNVFSCKCHSSIGSLGFPYHLIHVPWISLQSCVATCILWVSLDLFVLLILYLTCGTL